MMVTQNQENPTLSKLFEIFHDFQFYKVNLIIADHYVQINSVSFLHEKCPEVSYRFAFLKFCVPDLKPFGEKNSVCLSDG